MSSTPYFTCDNNYESVEDALRKSFVAIDGEVALRVSSQSVTGSNISSAISSTVAVFSANSNKIEDQWYRLTNPEGISTYPIYIKEHGMGAVFPYSGVIEINGAFYKIEYVLFNDKIIEFYDKSSRSYACERSNNDFVSQPPGTGSVNSGATNCVRVMIAIAASGDLGTDCYRLYFESCRIEGYVPGVTKVWSAIMRNGSWLVIGTDALPYGFRMDQGSKLVMGTNCEIYWVFLYSNANVITGNYTVGGQNIVDTRFYDGVDVHLEDNVNHDGKQITKFNSAFVSSTLNIGDGDTGPYNLSTRKDCGTIILQGNAGSFLDMGTQQFPGLNPNFEYEFMSTGSNPIILSSGAAINLLTGLTEVSLVPGLTRLRVKTNSDATVLNMIPSALY